MKTRRMATVAVMAAALLASLPARAATTNEVDIAALVVASSAGFSETNGWTVSSKLDSYTDASLRFNEWTDWIVSPDYGDPILRIEAKVRSSAREPTRWLCVFDAKTDANVGGFAASSSDGTSADRLVDFSELRPLVSQVKLMLDPSGSGSTGWGVGSLKVITTHPIAEPANLDVSCTGASWCGLSWVNGEDTVSNRVETYLIERGEGDEVLFETGFDEFEHGKNGTSNYTDRVAEMLGESFSGTNVLGAAGTNGICQLGTPDEKGFLRYAGLADYSNVELRLVLKRYETKDEKDVMLIAHEVDGAPIEYKTVNLPGEYDVRVVDLGKATAGSPIYIGYYNGVGGKRRVLIDSMSIVRTHPDTLTPVDSRWIPADSGVVSFSTKDHEIGLLPKSEYRFEVRAQNADGLVSPAATVDVVLDSPPGIRFILR